MEVYCKNCEYYYVPHFTRKAFEDIECTYEEVKINKYNEEKEVIYKGSLKNNKNGNCKYYKKKEKKSCFNRK